MDETLQLYFLCSHPSLSPSAAVALTLRAVGGLTTRQIARAHLVPEATMAQRISRAKRTVTRVRLDQPGEVSTVLRVLYLVFNEGYSGEVDLAEEAIRLTRQLAAGLDHPEVAGLLSLMVLHHARRRARMTPDGVLVPLADQDRRLWDTALIAEGVEILQRALARDRLGQYQAQAAIAALHADAPRAEETDWVQIVEWYDELLALTDSPVVRLNRAVAVGEADGACAGLAALPRWSRMCRGTRPSRPTSTSGRVSSRGPPTCTPRRPEPRPAWPRGTTSPGRRPASTPPVRANAPRSRGCHGGPVCGAYPAGGRVPPSSPEAPSS